MESHETLVVHHLLGFPTQLSACPLSLWMEKAVLDGSEVDRFVRMPDNVEEKVGRPWGRMKYELSAAARRDTEEVDILRAIQLSIKSKMSEGTIGKRLKMYGRASL